MSRFNAAFRVARFGALALAAVAASPLRAAPISFDVTGATLTHGAGYGSDAGANGENGGTLLGVQFTTTFTAQHFLLSEVGQNVSFDLATVRFFEPDTGSGGNRGIRNDELDELGLVARLTLTNAPAVPLTLTAIVNATPGTLSDTEVDYSIAWNPVDLDLGGGVQYRVSLNALSFTNTGSEQTLRATVEMLAMPMPRAMASAVPEPGSLALVCAALGVAGAVRRRSSAVPDREGGSAG